MRKMIVNGHRGFPAKYPENTLISFEKAIELGVDAIEYDLHLTRDGKLVVTHDDEISRCSNGHGVVEEMTFDELRKLDFGFWKSPEFAGEKIPLFTEVLDLVARKKPGLFQLVEVKRPDIECAKLAMAELKHRNLMDQFCLVCFHWNVLTEMKKLYPELLQHGDPNESMLWKPEFFKGMFRVGIHYGQMSKELTDWFHSQNVLVDAWTIDTEELLDKMIEMGADSVTSNDSEQILRLLEARGMR